MIDVRSEIEQILIDVVTDSGGDYNNPANWREATQAILALIDRVRIDETTYWLDVFADNVDGKGDTGANGIRKWQIQNRLKELKAIYERKK